MRDGLRFKFRILNTGQGLEEEGRRGVCLSETLHDAVEVQEGDFAGKGIVGHADKCEEGE